MIKNYLKVAIRSIFRNKLTAFINIAGLALAMACALLIYLFIADEVSYEKYHSKADRIYRITRSFHSPEGAVSLHLANVAPPIGPLLKNDFGEIETLARTLNYNGLVIGLEENGELKMTNTENNIFLAEPNIFKIFDIEIVSGDREKALERPFTLLLSERTAKRYFNESNPVGKRLRANNQFDLEVTGTYKDLPTQSHWHPEFLISFSTLENDQIYGKAGLESNWGNNSFGTYVLLHPGTAPEKLEARFPEFLNKHFGAYAKANFGAPADFEAAKTTTLFIQKVTDIHLRSHLDDELEPNGNINNVYMMAVIGLFIILIACFNFINLSTARATKRAKEVGLRKVVGAFRNQLIGQYLSESILIAFMSLFLAVIIARMGLTWMNAFTNKEISINFIDQMPLTAAMILFAVIVGILAGIYPAFVISSFKPALTLKGKQVSTGKGGIRKALVIAQFSISIVLIIATLVTFKQLDFLNKQDLGYNKDQIITLPYYNEVADNYDAFYNELTKSTTISNVGRSSRIPTGRLLDSYGNPRITKGDSVVNVNLNLKTIVADHEFFKTYGIDLVAGRNFNKAIATDDSLAFIINESAAKELGWTNFEKAIGQDFQYNGQKGKLIGIVKDFHFESLHQYIVPMIFLPINGNYNAISIALAGENTKAGIEHIEKVWKSFLPARPFAYQFLSERYQSLYDAEQKQSQLFTTFAGLAIFIASLGLFGLATFNTMQRIKEIGIRKVLGASVPNILGLLSKEIVILIVAANMLAWPVAYYFTDKWLNSFAYHIDFDALVYLIAATGAILLALVTVSAQTIKAAMSNPANTLRYE